MNICVLVMSHPQYTISFTKEQLHALVQLGQEDPDIDGDTILSIVDLAEEALTEHSSTSCL